MTRFSKWTIRLSLVYLVVGFSIGALMLSDKGFTLFPRMMTLLPVHIEFLMFGWFVHLIFGVAFWMFPRFTPRETGLRPRGFVRAAWLAVVLLNAGLVLFASGQLTAGTLSLRFAGRTLELLGIIAFFVNIWPRVKPVKST